MASFTKAIAAGNAYAQIGFIDSNGFLVGSATSAPANGAVGSGLLDITGIKTAAPAVPDPEFVQVTGDDVLLGEFDFESLTSRGFVIETAVGNLELDALLQGTNVVSFGDGKIGALDVLNPAELNAMLIIQSRAKKYNTGVVGQKGWTGVILPLATVKPLGRSGFDERGAAVYRYSVTPQLASNAPWGVTFDDTNFGTPGLRHIPFNFENPITMHAHSGNGSLQTFTLTRAPISAAKTITYSARVAQVVTGVSTTSPYSVTISGTPIGGAQMTTIYEFAA